MAEGSELASISEDAFKQGMRQLAASVNVITARDNDSGEQNGLTATAACSVSAEPPQLLICANSQAGAHDLIVKAGGFCLNVLALGQDDVAKRFAGMDGADRSERFDLGSWSELTTGAPALDDALANLDCVIAQHIVAGTHSVFIGRIVGSRTAPGMPLLYGDARFTGLAAAQ
ncbi:MAG: flavin reductase family protein [Proteobacteria bacterium]|nr:flavin reductase family protein [Pseudomonadota bacterium]